MTIEIKTIDQLNAEWAAIEADGTALVHAYCSWRRCRIVRAVKTRVWIAFVQNASGTIGVQCVKKTDLRSALDFTRRVTKSARVAPSLAVATEAVDAEIERQARSKAKREAKRRTPGTRCYVKLSDTPFTGEITQQCSYTNKEDVAVAVTHLSGVVVALDGDSVVIEVPTPEWIKHHDFAIRARRAGYAKVWAEIPAQTVDSANLRRPALQAIEKGFFALLASFPKEEATECINVPAKRVLTGSLARVTHSQLAQLPRKDYATRS